MDQTERVLRVTSEALQIQDRERLHYKLLGTTRGNILGPVGLPPWTDTDMTWNQSWAVKTKIPGTAGNIKVGGPCRAKRGHAGTDAATADDEDPEDLKRLRRSKNGVEPVFYHGHAMALDQEWKHMLKPVAVLDLTPGNGFMAEVCAVGRVPYIGI